MPKNPYLNAALATTYIALVASFMYYGGRVLSGPDDTVFAPIAMLSLLTLSAAVMGYLFFYIPIQIYLDGQKKEATRIFARTVLAFACLTVLAFLALFLSKNLL